ncbi:MAG: class I SAM-dependent methyltransferase [Desulfuromonadaceae bacterium]|nr:class I SAM-dependent methyltransferase [Desulfuromonadaceae bacterium]
MDNGNTLVSCRNCGSTNVLILHQGCIAPFFLKRVHSLQMSSIEDHFNDKANKPKSLPIMILRKLWYKYILLNTIYKQLRNFKSKITTDIRACRDCHFIGPDTNYTGDMLNGLYADYRSELYNNERELFEANYGEIKNNVGKNEAEIVNRLKNVSRLMHNINLQKINTVLDWGGGEGKFVPIELKDKKVYILDVSNEPLVNQQYVRINQPTPNIKADYIQMCHLLEHIGSPREFLMEAMQYLNRGGYVYIEVPQDQSEAHVKHFFDGDRHPVHIIHEHLNLFTVTSIKALAKSIGLKEIAVESNLVDFGWHRCQIISGLFMKQ